MANYQYMMSADDVAKELDCSKALDFRPDTSIFGRWHGYEPSKRSKGYDKEIRSIGRENKVCNYPYRSHEQGFRQ